MRVTRKSEGANMQSIIPLSRLFVHHRFSCSRPQTVPQGPTQKRMWAQIGAHFTHAPAAHCESLPTVTMEGTNMTNNYAAQTLSGLPGPCGGPCVRLSVQHNPWHIDRQTHCSTPREGKTRAFSPSLNWIRGPRRPRRKKRKKRRNNERFLFVERVIE